MVNPPLNSAIRRLGGWLHLHDQDRLMKTSSFPFADKTNLAVKRPSAFEETGATFDSQGRHWPELSVARNHVREFENTISEQSAELILRRTQIAELCNVRQQQENELLAACDEIDRLRKLAIALQDTVKQHDADADAAEQKRELLDKDTFALRAQLDKTLEESAELSQRLLSVETELNDTKMATVIAQEEVEPLKAQLTTKTAETIKLAAAIDEANRRHRIELNQQSELFEKRIKKIEAVAAMRDTQVKDLETTRLDLAMRCQDLAKTVDALASTQQDAREKIEYQVKHIEALESLFRVERETAERKIMELKAEMERERLEHSAAERASAAMRKDIVLLLPKLAERQNRPYAAELNNSISAIMRPSLNC